MNERNKKDHRSTPRSGSHNRNNYNTHNILPSAKVLEDYEAISAGSVNKLIEMAKKEQEHRHSWQDRYLKYYHTIYRSGQLFGFAYNILLLYIVYFLIQSNNAGLAIKLFVSNVLLIAFAILVTYTERKLTTRKPPRRHTLDNNKRPGQIKNSNSDANFNRGKRPENKRTH